MVQERLGQEETWKQTFYDGGLLRYIQGLVASVSASLLPAMELVTAPRHAANTGPILLLPGAFNPPTVAHLALAEAARHASNSSVLYFVLSTATINKEYTERATLLDRLLLLGLIAQRFDFLGVLMTNQGLYVEQAEAAQVTFHGMRELHFVIGFDKIVQIFDPRYYTDREAALKRLFALAHLLVAPRASHETDDVLTLMQQPENQPFQPFVHLIPLTTGVRDIASSQIRAAFQGKPSASNTAAASAAPLLAWLPPEVALFCEETGCYSPPTTLPDGETIDRYGLRCLLIDRALALPEEDQQQLRLHALFQLAVSSTPQGRVFRDWLNEPEQARSPEHLLKFQQQLPAACAQQEP
jgi:nicotinamide-nucleotide adenylyltransferase